MQDRKNAISFIAVIMVVLIISSALMVIYLQQKSEKARDIALKEGQQNSDRDFKDIRLTVYGSGEQELRWLINSGFVESSGSDGNYLYFSPLEIAVLNPEIEEIIYDISAAEASLYTVSGKLKLEGPVLLKQDELKLSMDTLQLEDGAGKFYGRGNISFSSPSFQLSGQYLEADLDLDIISVSGDGSKQAYLKLKNEG